MWENIPYMEHLGYMSICMVCIYIYTCIYLCVYLYLLLKTLYVCCLHIIYIIYMDANQLMNVLSFDLWFKVFQVNLRPLSYGEQGGF